MPPRGKLHFLDSSDYCLKLRNMEYVYMFYVVSYGFLFNVTYTPAL